MWNQPARENGHLEPLWFALACTDTFGSCHISRLGRIYIVLLTIISRSSPISACVASKVLNTVSPITLSTPSADCPLPNQRPEQYVRNGRQLMGQSQRGWIYDCLTKIEHLVPGALIRSPIHERFSLTSIFDLHAVSITDWIGWTAIISKRTGNSIPTERESSTYSQSTQSTHSYLITSPARSLCR